MNWSLIVLGLVAISSVAFGENSYLVIVPKLLKVGYDNQVSVFIAAASQPVEVKFDLTMGQQHIEGKTICKPGETRNATLTLPKEFPIGAGELTITGTGGIRFEDKRDIIVYDNRHVILVQTSASTYRPHDTMEIRVVATNENLIPIENGELTVEIYDAALKLVGEFPRIAIRSGLTETLRYPIAEHVNIGTWLVSATISNTTSSVQVLVTRPVTPSFDLKAVFQRFLLRTDKTLLGVIEIKSDCGEPIFGRATMAIGQLTEQEVESTMKTEQKSQQQFGNEEWRKWKSQTFEIAGRIETDYDLLSVFNVDVTKAIAVQVYIQVTDLASGQERTIRHIIPVFTHDVIYDIRPLEFEAGIKNEFEIIAKRPDGKTAKMEDMIVTVKMISGNEQGTQQEEKSVEIKDFYTRGRNDIGFFNLEIPENCIGVLMTITPLGEDGKVRGYRTHAVPLMPKPRRRGGIGAKLSVELLPSTTAPVHTDVKVPVVSSQISTVGRTSNFYVQLIPSKPVDKFQSLPMSYVLMSNGRIMLTGEFNIEPTKECQTKTVRTIRPEEQTPLACVFNGTLPIQITRDMVPYSTLLVYTFQPSLGYNVAESYRFSVAGLFQSTFTLNATVIPFTSTETIVENDDWMRETNAKPVTISKKAQDKTRVELAFFGVPDSTVGLNVFEYDGILHGLSNEITKERVLKYLTHYEQVPIVTMPTMPSVEQSGIRSHGVKSKEETKERSSEEVGSHKNKGLNKHYRTSTLESIPERKIQDKHERRSEKDEDQSGKFNSRRLGDEEYEEEQINRERKGYHIRYPIESTIFGVSSSRPLSPVEGDDIYTTSSMGRFYGEERNQRLPSNYRRKLENSINQYDVTVGENNYVVATSMPLIFTADTGSSSTSMPRKPEEERNDDVEINRQEEPIREQSSQYGTPSWYQKMNSKLNAISQEAFTFMQTGLTVVSDFESLRIPTDMKRTNLTKLFSKFRQQSTTFMDRESFDIRDDARQLLEEYLVESDSSMVPPLIMLEEESLNSYHRSIYFNTSRIDSQGTGKVVLPRTKPYSTWVATAFALNSKSGLAIAQPFNVQTNQGLFVLGSCPRQVQIGEHVLLTYGINNYLYQDVSNVIVRIRASADFDLIEQSQPERVVSSKDKDYTLTIPSIKTSAVEIRNIVLIPKRAGVVQIIIEVESEFGGDYEVLTMHVRESGIERKQMTVRLFDLTSEKKTYGPIVEKINPSPFLRSVKFSVSGTGLDRLVKRHAMETNSLVGIDRALVRLYRSLALRRYLNETSQTASPLFNITAVNITRAYQKLQLYSDYDGSYSFISDAGIKHSSLYLTSLAFGAMISPMMPFRDNVTLNRTLNWILSHQQQDGSFDDNGPCFHYRFCSGEFRRESLTALVLYSLTRDNSSDYMPKFIRHRLYDGETNPIYRAQHYLETRVPDVLPHTLTITLFEMAFIQNRSLSSELREKIHKTLLSRQLVVSPEDNSKYLKNMNDKMLFDDQLLLNSMTISLYASYGDFKTASDISRWVVGQIQTHPHYDTLLDAVFRTEAWIKVDCLFRKHFGMDKFDVTIDVTADNGQKQQFKINEKNMDVTQKFNFTLPVQQITYTVSGFGLALVRVLQKFVEKQQTPIESMPFELTHDFIPMSWMTEIKAKTCMTYTPTTKDQQLIKENFNRTVVVEVQIPSGMRVNTRQIGFFLSRVENVMYFTYEPYNHKLVFFINVSSTFFGKPICLEWCLERLSTVVSWAPIRIRTYDYLQKQIELTRLFPIQLQPSLLGYEFVEVAHKARPNLQSLPVLQHQKEANRV
jgi:hypothetical protein